LVYVCGFDPAIKPERGPLLAAIATTGSYLLADSRWFPQTSNPWDRSAMTLTVTVPEGQTVVATGRADAPTTLPGGKSRFRFRADQPTLVGTLAAGNFHKVSISEGAPITFYLRNVREPVARSNAATLGDIITFYSAELGPLENPEVAVVETPDDTWEAYGAPGLLLLPTRQWSESISPRLLARYLARQWWAGRVSPARRADAFLAEGLSRYSEALYIEHTAGEEGLRRTLEDFTIGALVDESAAPIANADRLAPYSPEFNSVVRDKGAMTLHMLRLLLGDEAFFRVLRDFARRFGGRGASIEEFERLTEEFGGKPVDYFFGQWVRSTGVPQFSLDYVVYRTRSGFRVGGELKHDLEIFRLLVPIRVQTEGPPVTQIVEAAGPSTAFSIETFNKPVRIEIDPDYDVLKYTPELKVRVAIARGESLFERGQYFEATREYQKALEVKQNSSLAHYRMGEAFFAQRNYQAAANSFREAVNGDQDPKWTLVWSHIFLGKVFDLTGQRERAINEYRRALDTNDNTQGAQAEAEKYLNEPYRRETRAVETIERQP
jgi:aminopeptidase N